LKAVILAAGTGSRLGNLTQDKPKCMLPIIDNKLLIDYQIEKLKEHGIGEKDIFVIGGYQFNVLKKHLSKRRVNLIFNPKFREWNNIYSFFLINDISAIAYNDDFLLLNSDTLFHKDILKCLLSCPKVNCIVLDIYKKLGKEEMKVLVKNGKIVKFGKDIPTSLAKGEYIGLAKFRKSELISLFDIINKLIKTGKTDIWYEIAFNYVLDEINIGYIDTQAKPWIEIDTVEDYEKAREVAKKL